MDTEMPTWMSPQSLDARKDGRHEMRVSEMLPIEREMERAGLERAFEYVIERLNEGAFLSTVIRTAPIPIHKGRLMAWVKRDSERWRRYNEALQVGAEVIASGLAATSIDEINELPTDANAKRVNFEIGKWYLGWVDKKRFAETKQVEINQSISITAALAQANGRVIEHEVQRAIEENDVVDR